MKYLIIALVAFCCVEAKSQSFSPYDLIAIRKTGESESMVVIYYAINSMAKTSQVEEFKYLNSSDSVSRDSSIFYSAHRFSNSNQSVVVNDVYHANTDMTMATVTYEMYSEEVFESFKRRMVKQGFNNTEKGLDRRTGEYTMWTFDPLKNDDYLKKTMIAIFKKRWGYSAEVISP